MENLTKRIDELFAQNRGKEAEELLEHCLREALQEGRLEEAVPILNELIGYCRETSQVQRSYEYADLVLVILDRMGAQGSIPYATTLLNIANAYRAGGRLEDSLEKYGLVMKIYEGKLREDDMLFASLYNNMSLLYQEMGSFDQAKAALLKALNIVEKREDAVFEIAVTYANLAASCLQLGQEKEAERYFTESIRLFEENQIFDTHYCAALSSMATYLYQKGDYRDAENYFIRAMLGIEAHLGRNEYYERMKENAAVCRQAYERQTHEKTKQQAGRKAESQECGEADPQAQVKGLALCREYYETYGKPMLESLFREYVDKIAVGLVGEGSDCFGFDDEISRDHDWGPGFNLWVMEETYAQIGRALQEAYDALPKEFKGYAIHESAQGRSRRGVHTINYFYKRILGPENCPDDTHWNAKEVRWEAIEDNALAAAVNGQVFADPEGIFTEIRDLLKRGCPKRLWYLKIAQAAAMFCQNGQYNYPRVLKRGDQVAAGLMLAEAVKASLKLLYYIEEEYPPHDKWLLYGLKQNGKYGEILKLLESAMAGTFRDGAKKAPEKEIYATSGFGCNAAELLEAAGEQIAHLLYQEGFISDTDSYLDAHTGELLFKAGIADLTVEELAEKIARLEFEAFDKVKNLGGRADCQDDWFTFSIMRTSQYLTWNHRMLMQYYYDFSRELELGHNLIEEKYGRMMESTAPAEYEAIKAHFPLITEQKKAIIESIVEIQVGWMEAFAKEYPHLAGNARSIHTWEDTPWNTSYETYLRGEISTYSDKMLELYGRYIVENLSGGKNIAQSIMMNSVLMYGYESLGEAERGLAR